MTDLEKAARMALEALEYYQHRKIEWNYSDDAAITAIREALAEQPEFFTHSVEQPYDWSEWVCPDPKSYLMKCCDCGLVHETQFGVVRYKSENEREDCEKVDDPNLQAVFRMRRSEQWSPEDTAYRPGGLPMAEQPAQQEHKPWCASLSGLMFKPRRPCDCKRVPLPTAPGSAARSADSAEPFCKPWVGLNAKDLTEIPPSCFEGAIWADAKLKEKNT